jgi:hypothetical protein
MLLALDPATRFAAAACMALVLVGAAIQVAVSAGLSVVCGSFLILWLGAAIGVPILLCLNLLASVVATAFGGTSVRWGDVVLAKRRDLETGHVHQTHSMARPLTEPLPTTSPTYWLGRNRLRAKMGHKFHALFAAVTRAMAQTPRSSSLVENLNSRLRNYFTLRRHLGDSYLSLLQFFLNHRRFMRSRRVERNGKSPRELMTGQGHPHWLTALSR